jgi:hypothetical protein
MVSPVLQESFYTGGFIVTEAPGKLSREVGSISNAGTVDLTLNAGLVLTQNNVGTPVVAPVGTPTGNGTITGVTMGNNAIPGVYRLVAASATSFALADPNGDAMQVVTVGTAYTDIEVGLLITAGGTAFVAGDSYTITVPVGDKSYAPFTGAIGKPAAALLFNLTYVPASGSKKVTVIKRLAEVNTKELQWDATVTNSGSVVALEAAALASLGAFNIIAR